MEFLGDLSGSLCFGSGIGLFESHFLKDLKIPDTLFEESQGAELCLDGGDPFHVFLSGFTMIPEAGFRHAGLNGREFVGKGRGVKETS